MERGAAPRVLRVTVQAGVLHIIVEGRSDKSLCMGPGGRVVARLAERLGTPVSVHCEDELIVRKRRLTRTRDRVVRVYQRATAAQREFLDLLLHAIGLELMFPEARADNMERTDGRGPGVALAYSGGTDSTASLVLLRAWGLEVRPVLVDPGYRVLGRSEIGHACQVAREMGVECKVVEVGEEYHTTVERALAGDLHPCGHCHEHLITRAVEWARREQVETLTTGELLPTGTHAVVLRDDVLLVHLPAALSLTKYRTELLARPWTGGGTTQFGCLLLREVHRYGWRMLAPSVYRVLRELEAGVLSTGTALRLIRSIVRPSVSVVGGP